MTFHWRLLTALLLEELYDVSRACRSYGLSSKAMYILRIVNLASREHPAHAAMHTTERGCTNFRDQKVRCVKSASLPLGRELPSQVCKECVPSLRERAASQGRECVPSLRERVRPFPFGNGVCFSSSVCLYSSGNSTYSTSSFFTPLFRADTFFCYTKITLTRALRLKVR